MDLVNQGKGSVIQIWNTNDTNTLSRIYGECEKNSEDFWNPSRNFKNKILKKFELKRS